MRRLGPTLFATSFLAACGSAPPSADPLIDVDLGPIEETLDEVDKTVWPGNVTAEGRHVRRLNGFFDGVATAYWFAGFASRQAPDVFWFCREGDEACPFDEQGRIDDERTIGGAVFSRVPGDVDYSPFWLTWVVYVPDDYRPDSLKSVEGIERAERLGLVEVERVLFDHPTVGPESTIMHCLVVLDGTELEGNGADLIDRPGTPSLYLPPRPGWHDGHSLSFFDFTAGEGVFPPDRASESRPMMSSADIFVYFRDCDGGSTSALCDIENAQELGAVSERGVETDFTTDGDKADNNNIISGFPRLDSSDPMDRPYSPLWKVNVVKIVPEHDDDVRLIDVTGDQDDTMLTTTAQMRDMIDRGWLREPQPMSETQAGNDIPGNDGLVFFNCPSQVGE